MVGGGPGTVPAVCMRKIGVVTTGRADYGIFRPLLHALTQSAGVELQLVVAGAHLAPKFGSSLSEILKDGYRPAAKVHMTLASDDCGSMARSMGLGIIGFTEAFERLSPDIVIVLGDRYETHAAAVTATLLQTPIVHIAGGTVSQGSVDDVLRNSITKLANVHFTETKACARRLQSMGEASWRIHVTGALGLDNIASLRPLSLADISERFGLALREPPLLATFHPETRSPRPAQEAHIDAFVEALEALPRQIVLTYPNPDAGSYAIIERLEAFAKRKPGCVFVVPHLGTEAYFSLMRLARAMIGNSSSGIVEAASFKLPVINVGDRQKGREAGANVIHVECTVNAIRQAVAYALSEDFRSIAASVENPYGTGHAADTMMAVLRSLDLEDDAVLVKEPA